MTASVTELTVTAEDRRVAWLATAAVGLALIDAAKARGMVTMEGFILASNDKMLKFARQLGFKLHRDADDPGMFHAERSL